MEELEPCGFSPTSTSQAPYLISFLRAESGEFRKLSRGFFFWTSLIEPCQEKIISQKGSGQNPGGLSVELRTWPGAHQRLICISLVCTLMLPNHPYPSVRFSRQTNCRSALSGLQKQRCCIATISQVVFISIILFLFLIFYSFSPLEKLSIIIYSPYFFRTLL